MDTNLWIFIAFFLVAAIVVPIQSDVQPEESTTTSTTTLTTSTESSTTTTEITTTTTTTTEKSTTSTIGTTVILVSTTTILESTTTSTTTTSTATETSTTSTTLTTMTTLTSTETITTSIATSTTTTSSINLITTETSTLTTLTSTETITTSIATSTTTTSSINLIITETSTLTTPSTTTILSTTTTSTTKYESSTTSTTYLTTTITLTTTNTTSIAILTTIMASMPSPKFESSTTLTTTILSTPTTDTTTVESSITSTPTSTTLATAETRETTLRTTTTSPTSIRDTTMTVESSTTLATLKTTITVTKTETSNIATSTTVEYSSVSTTDTKILSITTTSTTTVELSITSTITLMTTTTTTPTDTNTSATLTTVKFSTTTTPSTTETTIFFITMTSTTTDKSSITPTVNSMTAITSTTTETSKTATLTTTRISTIVESSTTSIITLMELTTTTITLMTTSTVETLTTSATLAPTTTATQVEPSTTSTITLTKTEPATTIVTTSTEPTASTATTGTIITTAALTTVTTTFPLSLTTIVTTTSTTTINTEIDITTGESTITTLTTSIPESETTSTLLTTILSATLTTTTTTTTTISIITTSEANTTNSILLTTITASVTSETTTIITTTTSTTTSSTDITTLVNLNSTITSTATEFTTTAPKEIEFTTTTASATEILNATTTETTTVNDNTTTAINSTVLTTTSTTTLITSTITTTTLLTLDTTTTTVAVQTVEETTTETDTNTTRLTTTTLIPVTTTTTTTTIVVSTTNTTATTTEITTTRTTPIPVSTTIIMTTTLSTTINTTMSTVTTTAAFILSTTILSTINSTETTSTTISTTTLGSPVLDTNLVDNIITLFNNNSTTNVTTIDVEVIKGPLTSLVSGIASVLIQSTSNSINNTNAAVEAFKTVGNLIQAISLAKTVEASTNALSILIIMVDVTSETLGDNNDSLNNHKNQAVGTLGNNIINVLALVLENTPLDLETGSVSIVIGTLAVCKSTVKFNGDVRNSINMAQTKKAKSKRADSGLFTGGIVMSVMTTYIDNYPTATPELKITAVTTPELYPVQNGLATETNISCPYQFRSNQIVTITADNVTSSNIRAVNGALTYVEFYQINTLNAACDFPLKSHSCGFWDPATTSWIFTDCMYKYENSTYKCICKKIGTIGLFISTRKSLTNALSVLESFTITIDTDYSLVANTISTVFQDINLYYKQNPNNLTKIVTIVSRIFLVLDDIIGVGYIDTTSATSIFGIFDVMLNQTTSFFKALNEKNNYASVLLAKFETIFRSLDVRDNYQATRSIYKAFATKPSTKHVFGIIGDQSNGLTASKEPNSSDVLPNNALFSAFFNETAVLRSSPNLRIFFLIFESTSAIIQSLISSLSNCENKIVSSKVIIAKASAQGIMAIDNKLFTAYFYQNNSKPTDGDCVYYTDFIFECVYLDTSANKWNTNGCTYSYSQNTHQCSCNHLTAFALSVSKAKCEYCAKGEFLSSVSGAGVFILCAVLAIVVLIIDKCSKSDTYIPQPSEILYQYYGLFVSFLINLILFNGVYIVFALLKYNLSNRSLCQAIGVLLHFFLITTFGFIMLMTILRYVQIYAPTKSKLSFTIISIISLLLVATIIVVVAIEVPSRLEKYVAPDNSCWLHDSNIAFAIVPAAIFFGFSFFFLIIIFLQIKCNLLRQNEIKNKFDFFAVILVSLLLSALTWLFGFMVMFPKQQSILYLNFIFALTYCGLSVCFGIFVLVSAITLAKTNAHTNRVGINPVKVVEVSSGRFVYSPHFVTVPDNFVPQPVLSTITHDYNYDYTMNYNVHNRSDYMPIIPANRINHGLPVTRRRSAQKWSLTPVE